MQGDSDKGLSNWDGKLDALKSIYLPDITRIGVEGLVYCVYLEEINTPNVTSIHENALGDVQTYKNYFWRAN